MRRNGVKTLLMGGQACVLYGAAELSRDLDLLILTDFAELEKLFAALRDLEAEQIAVPPMSAEVLLRGHAVHFRCMREDMQRLRIDLMSTLRGVDPFEKLWRRRTTIEIDGLEVDLLSLSDLVLAQQTQRDKHWSMIRRLVEQSWFTRAGEGPEFWLRELRSPELLVEAAREFPDLAGASTRPAVLAAVRGDREAIEAELAEEERHERRVDREYWEPLKREMEEMRRSR